MQFARVREVDARHHRDIGGHAATINWWQISCACRIFDSSGRLVAVSHHLGAQLLHKKSICMHRCMCPVRRASGTPHPHI